MEQPPEMSDTKFLTHVCQLQRALYGLKQAPCARFDRLRKYIFSNSFFYNLANPSLLFHIQLMVYLCC